MLLGKTRSIYYGSYFLIREALLSKAYKDIDVDPAQMDDKSISISNNLAKLANRNTRGSTGLLGVNAACAVCQSCFGMKQSI